MPAFMNNNLMMMNQQPASQYPQYQVMNSWPQPGYFGGSISTNMAFQQPSPFSAPAATSNNVFPLASTSPWPMYTSPMQPMMNWMQPPTNYGQIMGGDNFMPTVSTPVFIPSQQQASMMPSISNSPFSTNSPNTPMTFASSSDERPLNNNNKFTSLSQRTSSFTAAVKSANIQDDNGADDLTTTSGDHFGEDLISMFLAACKEDSIHHTLGGRSPCKVITYATLIVIAIYSMPRQRARVTDIYNFLEKHQYCLQEGLPEKYKLSVRHNLSTRPCFVRIDDDNSKRNSWWMVNALLLPEAARSAIRSLNKLQKEALKKDLV
jgi:hypothetical protein